MDEGKSKKATKVKNSCKICAKTVNPKTGIQCNGACQKWMHYTCLKYTPGKIQDIKDGFIKVTCPCPDCEGSGLKEEIISEPPFKCATSCCPKLDATNCDSLECPISLKLADKRNAGDKKYEMPPDCSLPKSITPQTQVPTCSLQSKKNPKEIDVNSMEHSGHQNQAKSPKTCQNIPIKQPDATNQILPQSSNRHCSEISLKPPCQITPVTQKPCKPCPIHHQLHPNDKTMPQRSVPQCLCQTPQKALVEATPISKNEKKSCDKDQFHGTPYATSAKQSQSCSCIPDLSSKNYMFNLFFTQKIKQLYRVSIFY